MLHELTDCSHFMFFFKKNKDYQRKNKYNFTRASTINCIARRRKIRKKNSGETKKKVKLELMTHYCKLSSVDLFVIEYISEGTIASFLVKVGTDT